MEGGWFVDWDEMVFMVSGGFRVLLVGCWLVLLLFAIAIIV